jgi:hypothetical protein
MENHPSEYKAPILTQIYWLIGGLCVLLAFGSFAYGLANNQQGVAFAGLAVCFVAGLLCFGVAQVVDYIGQTAHNTRAIADLLRRAPRLETPLDSETKTEPSRMRSVQPRAALIVAAALLLSPAIAQAQKFDEPKTDAQLRVITAAAVEQDAVRLSRLPQSLIHGKILSVGEDGYLVSCDSAKVSHPAMPSIAVYVKPSQDRLVWIARDPAAMALNHGEGTQIDLLGKEDGTHTYTTVLQRQNTVANFRAVEVAPPGSVVTLLDRDGKPIIPAATANVARGSAYTPELTLKRGW